MEKQTAGRDQLGAFAPKFAQLNDDVLFGEVWTFIKRPFPCDGGIFNGTGLSGFVFPISFDECKE